jgi:glycosyltransferase involved in cell wall biosynthesis
MLQRVRESAAGVHQQVRRAVAQQRVDVLVGCFASPLLYGLDAGRPLVHFSDLTFRLLVETYAWAREMPRHQRVATEAVERDVLRRCDAHLVPTRWARDSMVRDYGVQTHRIHVIPLGANLGEEATAHAPGASSGPPLPSRSGLRLTITAANAQRKRLDLAVQTTSILRRRGWNASLSCVGGQTARAREAPFVHCHGRLDHNDPQQRRQHVQLIRDSHVMMLPSEAEAFGIAPIEAAHLGVPSVVSAAGGLREVVQDRRTGRVVPVDAPADAYADAVEDLVADLPGYRACCAAAQRRAREELSWSHFASAALAVLEDLCRHHQRLRRCA